MIWIGVIFLLFVWLWFSKIKIEFNYKREKENDQIKIEIKYLYGLVRLKKEYSSVKVQSHGLTIKEDTSNGRDKEDPKKKKITFQDIKEYREQVKVLLKQVVQFNKILKKFLLKIQVLELSWWSRIGTGDAADTGILSGVVWAIKSGLVLVISHFVSMTKTPKLIVEPSFMTACLYTEFLCIVQFKVGDAILAGVSFLLNWRKGRRAKWQSTQFKV